MRALQADLGDAGIAVVTPTSTVDTVVGGAGARRASPFGLASRGGLEADVTVVPVELAKGLELDGVVLVEPAKRIVDRGTPRACGRSTWP